METSVVPKKLSVFIIESSRRSCMLAWISTVNALTRSKYVLAMEKGRFVRKKTDTQQAQPTPFHSNQRLAVASAKM